MRRCRQGKFGNYCQCRLCVANVAGRIYKVLINQHNIKNRPQPCARQADAMNSKVSVVARSISEMALGARVATRKVWVGDEACRDILKCCNIIFGCTDDHEGRTFINRFAYYYLTPVIDIGLVIEVGDAQSSSFKSLDGRVTVLIPENTCLLCRETINSRAIGEEELMRRYPDEYEKRKAEAYVLGEGNPSPAVVTFTTELACMEVNEMIHRLQGFRGAGRHIDNRIRKFHLDQDCRPGKAKRNDCKICETNKIWGAGDVDPFLDRVS